MTVMRHGTAVDGRWRARSARVNTRTLAFVAQYAGAERLGANANADVMFTIAAAGCLRRFGSRPVDRATTESRLAAISRHNTGRRASGSRSGSRSASGGVVHYDSEARMPVGQLALTPLPPARPRQRREHVLGELQQLPTWLFHL